MSDLLVLSLPISILWKVRISVRQKIGLAFTLCLSCVMIIVAIVRVAGMVRGGGGSVDVVWVAFWQHQECSIAVLMISVSAFRSLFVPSPTDHPVQRHQGYSPSDRRRKFLRRRPDPDLYDTHETGGLPQIPSATFAGTAIVVGEGGHSEETADLGQQFHGHLPASGDDHSTVNITTDSSVQDTELGLSTESDSVNKRRTNSNTNQGKSKGTRWWKSLRQPDTARTLSTTRTGYWDVLSFFRTGHTDSVIESKNQSHSQL